MTRYLALVVVALFCLEYRTAYAQDQGSSADLDSVLGTAPAAPASGSSTTQAPGASPPPPTQPATGAPAAAANLPANAAPPAVTPGDQNAQNAGAEAATPEASTPGNATAATPGSTSTTTARAPSKNRLVEEIIVTAEKREENIQKVPISIQAFSGSQLDAKGIDNPGKLALVTPGLQFNTLVGYTFVYIRGVGSDTFIPSADASVATYIDGIYYPFGFGLASALGSVQRVEVLKGPQGTLFGRNSSGGAISIVTKQPDPGGDFTTSVLASRESFNTAKLRVFMNIPLTDTLALSISGLRYQGDSFYKQSTDSYHSGPLAPEISQGFSAKIGFKPFDDLKAVVGYTLLNTRGSYGAILPAGNGPGDITPLGKALGVTASPDFIDGDNAPDFINIYSRVLNADIKYHTPWFDTRFLGAIQHITPADVAVDYDGSSAPLVSFETTGQFSDVRTAELQFLSNDSAPDWLKAVAGIYYIVSQAGYHSIEFNVGNGLLGFLANPGAALSGGLGVLPAPVVNALEPFTQYASPLVGLLTNVPGVGNVLNDFNGGNVNGEATLILQGILGTASVAGYFQTTAQLPYGFAATIGARYQAETRELVVSNLLLRNPLDRNEEILLNSFPSRSASTYNLSPKAVLDYSISDDQHVYGSFSEGYKSGTFNIIAIDLPPSYVRPEKVTAFELGYKSNLFDDSLKFNAAIFDNVIDNLQVGIVSLTSGGVTNFETAGSARVFGSDFDMQWQVLPDTLPGLVITGGGAYLHGRYTSYVNGSGYDDTTGLFYGGSGDLIGGGATPGRDFTGHHTVRTPAFSGNAGPSYSFDLGDGQVELASSLYYNTGFYFAASNSQLTRQKPYRLLDAHVGYFYTPWKTRLTVYGENLTNQRYDQTIQQFDFDTSVKLDSPIVVGVKLQWDY